MKTFDYFGMVLITMLFSFFIGAKVGKETTESDMYYRDYRECVSELPRNLDCEAVKIIFKEVDDER